MRPRVLNAEEGIRTPTLLRASDFESPVSAIPPLRLNTADYMPQRMALSTR